MEENSGNIKIKHKPQYIFCMVFFIFLTYGFISCINEADNDFYWMAATGNYMLDNLKIPSTTFWNLKEYPTIIQQPLCCLVNAVFYRMGGNIPCMIFSALSLVFTLFWIAYFIKKYVEQDNINGLMLTLSLVIFPLSLQASTRSHMLTISAIIILMCHMERFRRSERKTADYVSFFIHAFLIGLFINIWQSSFTVFFCLLLGTYLVPFSLIKKGWFKPYLKKLLYNWPYAAAILVLLAAGCILPGGIQRELYLLKSSEGVKLTKSFIGELVPLKLYPFGAFAVAIIAYLTCWFIKRRNEIEKNGHIFWLSIGLGFGATLCCRNFWFWMIPVIYMLPISLKNIKDDCADRKSNKALYIAVTGLAVIYLGVFTYLHIDKMQDSEIKMQKSFVEYLDSKDKDSMILFTDFNMGGYYELSGYKTYIDARPELYTININKNEEILSEYININESYEKSDLEEFVDKYSFTDLVVPKNIGLYTYLENRDNEYNKVRETEQYALFEKK